MLSLKSLKKTTSHPTWSSFRPPELYHFYNWIVLILFLQVFQETWPDDLTFSSSFPVKQTILPPPIPWIHPLKYRYFLFLRVFSFHLCKIFRWIPTCTSNRDCWDFSSSPRLYICSYNYSFPKGPPLSISISFWCNVY